MTTLAHHEGDPWFSRERIQLAAYTLCSVCRVVMRPGEEAVAMHATAPCSEQTSFTTYTCSRCDTHFEIREELRHG